MINLKASRKTPTINISANPITNVHVTNRSGGDAMSTDVPQTRGVVYPNPGDIDVQSIPNGEFVSVTPQQANIAAFTNVAVPSSDNPEVAKLLRENAVLKLIIDILHSNPMIVNKYIIADDEKLMRMVALLCNATQVHIDADDVGCGCVSKNTYRKVHSIYVVVDGQTKNLKYDFSDVMYTLKEFHISTKYVWWNHSKWIIEINLSRLAIDNQFIVFL